jgi:hypothetical protein
LKAKIAHDGVQRKDHVGRLVDAPRGTVIEHPDAWQLVRAGVAIPADDECRERAGLNPEQIARCCRAYRKMNEENLVALAHGLTPGQEISDAEEEESE